MLRSIKGQLRLLEATVVVFVVVDFLFVFVNVVVGSLLVVTDQIISNCLFCLLLDVSNIHNRVNTHSHFTSTNSEASCKEAITY